LKIVQHNKQRAFSFTLNGCGDNSIMLNGWRGQQVKAFDLGVSRPFQLRTLNNGCRWQHREVTPEVTPGPADLNSLAQCSSKVRGATFLFLFCPRAVSFCLRGQLNSISVPIHLYKKVQTKIFKYSFLNF